MCSISLNNYKKIKDLPKFVAKLIPDIPNTVTPYAKIMQQTIDFTDFNDIRIYSTVISFVCFKIVDNETGDIVDKFIVPAHPFRVRTRYELESINEIINSFLSELESQEPSDA